MTESEQPNEEPAKQRQPKLSAEKALPKSGAETLVKIIKGYAVASSGGDAQVGYKDVASAAGISPTVVSANNSFLLESQILTSPKYGFYVPTESAVRFAREAAWDEAGAKAHLRKIVLECWFGQVVTQNFTLRSSIAKEDLKRSLAIKCGATEGDANSLASLMDFIIYTGLVVENENGTLVKGNFDELATSSNAIPASGSAESSIGSAKAPSIMDETVRKRSVSLVIHIHVNSVDELTTTHAAKLKEWMRTLEADENNNEVYLNTSDKLEFPA